VNEAFPVASGAIGELFFNVNDAVLVAKAGRVLAWSPSAERLLGLSAEEATAPKADLARAFGEGLEEFWRLVASGGHGCIECDGGSDRILEATAWRLGTVAAERAEHDPVDLPGDGIDHRPTVVVLHDVTAERRHAKGLATLNGLARELLAETSLDVLLTRIVDAAKELSRADFSALVTLRDGGPEVDHFVYNAPRNLFPARLPRLVGLLAVPVETKSVVRIDDIRGHPAGVGIPVEHPPIAALLAAPVLIDDAVVGELAVANQPERGPFDSVDEAMLIELAAHAAMAVSLVRARESQQQVTATRRALMDTALHNIRTPLTVAKGFLATLRTHFDALTPEDRSDAFDAIERAHERIQLLAEGALLDHPFTEVPAKEADGIDVVALGEQVLADLKGLRSDVDMRWVIEDDAPDCFEGDRQLVSELLGNLLSNAVKHAPSDSAVTVTVRREGESVRFDVSDRGPGIPAEEQSRVFEQFYRTRQSVSEGVAGTGLGLWIVRRLGELLGGTVGLSSRPGQGTTFWVTFPLEGVAPTREAV